MKNNKPESKSEKPLPLKKNTIMNSGKTVLGILAVFGVGVLLGIVIAPQKGSKIRRKIAKNGEKYLDSLKNQFDDFLNESADKIEKLGEVKDNLIEKEKALLIETKNGIKSTLL